MTAVLKPSTGHPHARLMSVAGARGSRVVDNHEMSNFIETSDEWIQQRTGIVDRRWVDEDQTPLSLATEAARLAIERAGLALDQVDGIICCTISHFKQTPSLACEVARDLGLGSPVAFDISAACAGWNHGLAMAESLVRTGGATHVVVIGVEVLTRMLDTSDRGTAFIFSDGAGAGVVGPSETPAMGPVTWGSDPSQSEVIETDDWLVAHQEGRQPYIRMEGQKVFRWATTHIADRTRECLERSGITADELDVFIPHQANNRITDSMLRHLKLPENVVVSRDVKHMGNSSAASVPLAMDALLASGEARSGQTALCIGFGAGLVYAGQVLTLP